MFPNAKPSEQIALLARIDPDAQAASTVDSVWVSAKNFHQFMAIFSAGDLGAAATMDASIRQATDSAGTGAKAITGKAITQFTQAGTDSDKATVINLRTEEMDVDNGFDFLSIRIIVATAASEVSGILLGISPVAAPANAFNGTFVDEIVG